MSERERNIEAVYAHLDRVMADRDRMMNAAQFARDKMRAELNEARQSGRATLIKRHDLTIIERALNRLSTGPVASTLSQSGDQS